MQTTASIQGSKRVTYLYDPAGRRTLLRDPDSGVTTSVYDAAGQLTKLVSPQEGRTTFTYDLAGRERVKRLANWTRTTQTFDAAGQMTVLFGPGAGSLRRQTYTFDDAGRRRSHAMADGTVTTWTYDDAGQLRTERRNKNTKLDIEHRYDAVGNRLAEIQPGSRNTSTYDAAPQEHPPGVRVSDTPLSLINPHSGRAAAASLRDGRGSG